MNAKFAPAYFQRGKLEWEMGDTGRALADLQLATNLDPAYAQPYYIMAQIYFKQGKRDQAEQAREILRPSAASGRKRSKSATWRIDFSRPCNKG